MHEFFSDTNICSLDYRYIGIERTYTSGYIEEWRFWSLAVLDVISSVVRP